MNHGHRCLFTCLGWYHTTSWFSQSLLSTKETEPFTWRLHQACGRVHSHYEHASFRIQLREGGREERGWIGRMFHLLVCCNKGESPIMITVTPTLKSWGSKVEDLVVSGALLSTGRIYRHLRHLLPLYNLHHMIIQPPALTLCMSVN